MSGQLKPKQKREDAERSKKRKSEINEFQNRVKQLAKNAGYLMTSFPKNSNLILFIQILMIFFRIGSCPKR